MNIEHERFSRSAKLVLAQYLAKEKYTLSELSNFLENVQSFDLTYLQSNQQKKAFWINIYNGLTNYMIVKNRLWNSVWEKPDFFTDSCLKIGEYVFSLDDIEHGVLRKNGQRRNNKPSQFLDGDHRQRFMIETMDYRVHFALNCGSLSCPPVAFYSEDKIEEQLGLAEESFSSQEFIVLKEEKTIECSSIFVWYRMDFGNHYLNDSVLSQYTVTERPYVWKIQ